MRPKQIVLTLPATSTVNVCALQTTAGAGNLLINGSAAVSGAVSFTTGLALSLTSTGNISAVTFAVTGLDENGNAQTENITGPNNNTVAGLKYWTSITQIAVNGAVGTNTSVGIGGPGLGQACTFWQALDHTNARFNVGVELVLTGTISATAQQAFEDVLGGIAPTWAIGDIPAMTANGYGAFTKPITAMRLVVTYTSGATCKMNIVEGYRS